MNDHELDQALTTFHVERTQVSDPPMLHERVLALPFDDIPQQRPWLPQSPKSRFPSMFSATRFVVAGAIVALFGGFLLASALPNEADHDWAGGTYEAALASLRLEEVAPGISRVIGDDAGEWQGDPADVAFGADGTIWIRSGDGGGTRWLRRAGHEDEVTLPDMGDVFDIAVGPDDRLWVAALRGLATFDGEVWEEDRAALKSFEIMPDGTPWALRVDGTVEAVEVRPMPLGGYEVGEAPSFEVSGKPTGAPLGVRYESDSAGDIAVTTGGDIWVGAQLGVDGWLARNHEGTWSLEQPLGDTPFGVQALAAAPDGALWALLMIERGAFPEDGGRPCCEPVLARFDGGHWATWSADVGLPLAQSYIWPYVGGVATVGEPGTPFAVAPDGTVWMGDLARGLVSFDGVDFSEYETGPADEWGQGHATEIAFAPDGTTWVVVWKEYDAGLYIIAPEAVAAPKPSTDHTSPDLLPGVDLATEEVEPGVYQVLSDGVRDIDWNSTLADQTEVVTTDDDVWLVFGEAALRLGDREDYSVDARAGLPHEISVTGSSNVELVTADYVYPPTWSPASRSGAKESSGDSRYSPEHPRTDAPIEPTDVPDATGYGTNHAVGPGQIAWVRPGGLRLRRHTPDGIEEFTADDGIPVYVGPNQNPSRRLLTVVAPDGAAWFSLFDRVDRNPVAPSNCGGLVRYDGEASTYLLQDRGFCVLGLDVDAHGRAWVLGHSHVLRSKSIVDWDGPAQLYVITPEAVAAAE